jgi:predicted enzyme related to lactoylglutathione lyase
VDDFEGYVKKVRDAGAKFVIEPTEYPGCWMTVVADPDGNRVVLHRRKSR